MRDERIVEEVRAAESRIRKHVLTTPLERSPYLSELVGADVYLKLECQQLTGSFKLRGAMSKILALETDSGSLPAVVTASSGNHAAAVAYTLYGLGRRGVIYLSENVSKAKVAALEPYGAELRFVGTDSVVGEIEARKAAKREGLVYVSPYSDEQVIGGQGTVALELERQTEHAPVDRVLVPVGGGGLIAGVGGYLKARHDGVRILGCQPERSRVMAESVSAGRILELESEPTIADGTAGGIEPGAITFDICRRVVDDFVLLSEEEILGAMRYLIEHHYLLVEGAAAMPVAALLKEKERYRGHRVALVITGKKVSTETIRRALDA